MNYAKVESSQIAEVGYDAETETLGLKFPPNKKQKSEGLPGSEYHYSNVPPRVHRAMMEAESVGSYFGQNIKSNPELYPYVKVETDPQQPGRCSTSAVGSSSTNTATLPETSTTDTPSTALSILDTMADDLLFTPGAVTDEQLAAGREWYLAGAKKYDISTEKSRTELKRFARPLQKLRTGIEARAKELTGSTKRKIAAIDAEKRRLVQIVGGIEQEVLQTLNDYEAAEESRIETRNAAIKEIQEAGPYTQSHWMELSLETMRERLHEIESDTREWPELGTSVQAYRQESIRFIKASISAKEEYEKGQEELAKLRAEAAERAESDRLALVVKEAKEQAKRDQEAAVEAERKRAADAKKEEKEAADKREADANHRREVDVKAESALVLHASIDMKEAQAVVFAIHKGLIPGITINY